MGDLKMIHLKSEWAWGVFALNLVLFLCYSNQLESKNSNHFLSYNLFYILNVLFYILKVIKQLQAMVGK